MLKISRNRHSSLLPRHSLLFMATRGDGLWHYDDGTLTRFYYARPDPESLDHYIGFENIHCAIPGTKPVKVKDSLT
jgi:hypothetical protein